MPDLIRDIRYAVRSLLRAPGFTVVAVLTLALGIGANTAIFSVFNGVLLRPLDYPQSDHLVAVFDGYRSPTSPANFLDLREQSERVEQWTAAHPWSPVLRGEERPEQLQALKATPSLFDLLGVDAALGRTFRPSVDAANEQVAVLGHALWQRRFGSDPEIVGRALSLDGADYVVIGVMPAGFEFPPFWATGAELWVPLVFTPEQQEDRQAGFLRLFGRLVPGADLHAARSEIKSLAGRLASAYPEVNEGLELTVEALMEPVVGGVRSALGVLLGTVGFVLLIACANVANLFMVRASARRGEIAIRSALGAGRANVLRQLLTESLVLALVAGGLGLLLGLWGLEALVALAPENVPRLAEISFDGRVFAFSLMIALLTGGLFGLFPALSVLRSDLRDALREGSRQVAERRGGGARRALVVAEISLSLILLVGAALMLQSLARLWTLDPGFRTANVLTMDLSLAGSEHEPAERQGPFFDQLVAEVGALPGVTGVGLINHLPIGGDIWRLPFQIEGRPAPSPSESPRATVRTISPTLLATMDIPVLTGRGFDQRDRADSQPVVLVSQSLAERYWGQEPVVGQRIRSGGDEAEWLTIVGVVGDVRQWELSEDITPGLYRPYSQNPFAWFTQTSLVMQTAAEPAALVSTVANRIWELEPNVPIAQIRTMNEILAGAVWRQRFNASLLALFAGLALVLAAVGIYGVMSFSVLRRRSEIGVRMALGAGRRQILQWVVGQGLWITACGLVVGLLGAAALSRFLGSLLFEVPVTDPRTFVAVSVLLAFVALVACYLPARRASRLDPLSSLRSE
ncbi:MAG: ABC transporter permease [Acidobacteriota bacterium]